MRIYLDHCCYNRPFDEQTQLRIALETQAKLFIQTLIIDDRLELVWSYISTLENYNNPYENRRLAIDVFSKYAKQTVVENDIIIKSARKIGSAGLKPADALHLACAIEGEADYFITTDDEILKYETAKIKIIDPIQFVKTWEGIKK
ncbi:putative PIN domain protein [Candidatus Termititenax persephonae]|uniref:PIN domain protein n=1 Tax=Candidatus Termititenax persephonae TaxID=2218525 RepID=A0A388THV4_9BACT|nr:putative PIN domain protein [Candidatus Termititenax persephonae]